MHFPQENQVITADSGLFFEDEYQFDRPPASRPPASKRRWATWLVGAALLLTPCLMLWHEARTSWLQARWLPEYASSLAFTVAEGPSDSIVLPSHGPFDQRLGYAQLPAMLDKLTASGFYIDRQARFSQALHAYTSAGFYPPYAEKTQAGLLIRDADQTPLYAFRYPRNGFASFGEVPPLMVEALLFIEDRRLLADNRPQMNPTVNWGRFLKAAVFKAGEHINLDTPAMGGSTLATQIEKFRHSDQGVTGSVEEKLRQMVSASVRVYRQGANTLPARQQLVLDYLNTVPLAAAPGVGEVNGIGDGLVVWFGAEPAEITRLLALAEPTASELRQQAKALRQVLALLIAHRRPSYYLLQNRTELNEMVDAHLRLLAEREHIRPALVAQALAQPLEFRNFREQPAVVPAEQNKGVNVVRNRLVNVLDVSLYTLDRLDLEATTTLEWGLQESVTAHLRALRDPQLAQAQGLAGQYLLGPGQAANVRYSFTLFERTAQGNQVRVQTDNTDVPFNINEGSKLELGSTAKLRVLATYLEIIAELHQRHSMVDEPLPLPSPAASEQDPLSRWVRERLADEPHISLPQLLAAALERRYSAHPGEAFYTGGGQHRFSNFKPEDNHRNPTVREAFNESINLPFVRILRDVISHITHHQWQNLQAVMEDDADPRRREVLARFADREGEQFLARFWGKYASLGPREQLDAFVAGLALTPVRAAVIHRYLYPNADLQQFSEFLAGQLNQLPPADALAQLYTRYDASLHSLQDLGYLARVHPLELWLVGFLLQHQAGALASEPSFADALAASAKQRQEVYRWLSRTRARNARDNRVRTMLEVEAFAELHRRWHRLGFPFKSLVPSLATALGSSGDRPAALAELMGIILNDGEHRAPRRISRLVFAANTPYETHVSHPPAPAEPVLHPDVAHALKLALADVVQTGTGRRLRGAYKQADGSDFIMGGKTGTGDNRLVATVNGQRVTGRALSRTATLVFYLGDNHFGTLTAFVVGDVAEQYRFTSALPTQVLRGMAPLLQAHLQRSAALAAALAPATDALAPLPQWYEAAMPKQFFCGECSLAAHHPDSLIQKPISRAN